MTIIQRLNGTKYDLTTLGIRTKEFDVPSPNYETEIDTSVEGTKGGIDYGTELRPRQIEVTFRIHPKKLDDFPLKRMEVFRIFESSEAFYLIDSKVPYIRWLVKVEGSFNISRSSKSGEFTVPFIAKKGVAESIGTSLQLHDNDMDAEQDLWGFGQGLEAQDYIYRHNAQLGQSFVVHNPSDVEVHPFEDELKMTITNVRRGQSVGNIFQITNLTNGSRARVNLPLIPRDVVVYDGPLVTINGLHALRDTRRDFIHLSPGRNVLQIYYVDRADIDFDFRFLYL